MRICIVGSKEEHTLEASYKRAFIQLGEEVQVFDIDEYLKPHIRLGRLGQMIHRFMPLDVWQRKLNRELALAIQSQKPDMVLVFCNAPVLFSTLAFAKSLWASRFVLVWPDPLTNMQSHVLDASCLYDGVATYCRASVPVFEKMGFQNVQWIPLAADPDLHRIDIVPGQFLHDLTFLGAWRPEREQTLAVVIKLFPSLRVGIWGTDWTRNQTRTLERYIRPVPLRGRAYAEVMNKSRINLNIIDPTCFPAANMRFFETFIAHGLQLNSACPEFQDTYIDNQHMLSYDSYEELFGKIEWAMSYQANSIRREGFQLTLQQHTYRQRAKQFQECYLSSSVLKP